MRRETMGTNIESGVIQRITQGVKYIVSGVKPATWFGPYQPLPPIAQDPDQGAAGRRFDYPVGYNLNIRPRTGEPISFGDLRGLADGYDILRLAIETRKDQIEGFDWGVFAKDDADQEKYTDDIKKVTEFLMNPSTEYDWQSWLRASLEDVFVIDAWAICPVYAKSGKLISLDLVDGATIKKVIDEYGHTPQAPDPAYQQILHGVPAVDYSADDIIYSIRNPRTNRVYGFSPTEQIITTVNIALRRQLSQLSYYTAGNVPDAIVGVDPSWTADQIKEMQVYFDSLFSGNNEERRKLTFLPGDASKVQMLRQPDLKGEFDEWLARVVCYAFSLPPTAFVKQQNRATAQSAKDTATEEGLLPLLKWLKRRLDYIINKYIGADHLEFRWDIQDNVDPVQQTTMHESMVKIGAMAIDEMRKKAGMEPLADGIGQDPLVYTATGVMRLSDALVMPDETQPVIAAQQDQGGKHDNVPVQSL